MIDRSILSKFSEQLDNLSDVVSQSSARMISDPPDPLFYSHQNVFIKSYLVSACSILEAFIQELTTAYVDALQKRINSANLPYNFVVWIAEHEKAKLEFKPFSANKNKKDISDLISPNYWRTMNAFTRVGVDLSTSNVDSYKYFIAAIVDKRNKIVHHNDDALDLSYIDVKTAIRQFKSYCECLFDAVRTDRHI